MIQLLGPRTRAWLADAAAREQGNRSDLEVVEIDGRWRIELMDQLEQKE